MLNVLELFQGVSPWQFALGVALWVVVLVRVCVLWSTAVNGILMTCVAVWACKSLTSHPTDIFKVFYDKGTQQKGPHSLLLTPGRVAVFGSFVRA